MRIFVGIDQGIASTGIVIIDENKEILSMNYIQTTPKQSMQERLTYIKQELLKMLVPHKGNISLIACEELFANGLNASGVIKTAYTTGVIYSIADSLGADIEQIPATSVKKRTTGNGRATKEDVQDALEETYNLDDYFNKHSINTIANKSHIADALAIILSLIEEG